MIDVICPPFSRRQHRTGREPITGKGVGPPGAAICNTSGRTCIIRVTLLGVDFFNYWLMSHFGTAQSAAETSIWVVEGLLTRNVGTVLFQRWANAEALAHRENNVKTSFGDVSGESTPLAVILSPLPDRRGCATTPPPLVPCCRCVDYILETQAGRVSPTRGHRPTPDLCARQDGRLDDRVTLQGPRIPVSQMRPVPLNTRHPDYCGNTPTSGERTDG